MSAVNITKENFVSEVLNSEQPVLLDFWAGWCAPCRMLSPIVDEIGNTTDVKIGKINVDEEYELADIFNIMAMPTLMALKNGEVTSIAYGARPKADILRMLEA